MKLISDVIQRSPVWINPEHTVETAIILMSGHQIGALPVLSGSELVGLVLYSNVMGAPPTTLIRDIMLTDIPLLRPEMTIKEAADIMSRSDFGRLPVVAEGKLVGVITSGDLLPELGRSFDPLTELPWSDSLREWAISELQAGHEITVLFLDLDNFGPFNKRYGHIVGDDVLKAVAQALRDATDKESDFLCRYGGDEFAIATVRSAPEAEELSKRIERRITSLQLPELGDEKLSVSIGQFGGKRTREREHVHYAATLNNLINLASQSCTESKTHRKLGRRRDRAHNNTQEDTLSEPRLRLSGLQVSEQSGLAHVQVELEMLGGQPSAKAEEEAAPTSFREFVSRPVTCPEDLLRLVAYSTASAITRSLPNGYSVEIEQLMTQPVTGGREAVTVVGSLTTPEGRQPGVGSALVGESGYHAAAKATLAAFNRIISRLLRTTERTE